MRSRTEIDWLGALPYIFLHLACFAVLLVGWSWFAVAVAAVIFFVRVFGVTAFYHRYFAHRAFKTSRLFQFVGAVMGNAAVQRGPLWWASHHRAHHRNSDRETDAHSPHNHGFWWSHTGWFLNQANLQTDDRLIPDLLKYPELRFLDRFHLVVPLILAGVLFVAGEALRIWMPQLGAGGWQLLVWGFVLSTVALYHTTFAVNSVAHTFGSRRFQTKDQSRNNLWLALITWGEGWHNNHHHYPAAARQGFYWWEVDVTYYVLFALSFFGVVWDLKAVPRRVLAKGRER